MARMTVGHLAFELGWAAGQVRLRPDDERWWPACVWIEASLRTDVPAELGAGRPVASPTLGLHAWPQGPDRYQISAHRDSDPRLAWAPLEVQLPKAELIAVWRAYLDEQRRATWPWVLRRPPLGAAPAPFERHLGETWERAWAVVAGAPRDDRWTAARARLLAEIAPACDPSPVVEETLRAWGLSRLLALRRGQEGEPSGRSLDELSQPENAWPHVFRPDPLAAEPAPGEQAWATAICRRVEIARLGWTDPEGARWASSRGEVLSEAQRIVCAPDAHRWLEAWELAALIRYHTAWTRARAWFGREGGLLGWPLAIELFEDPPPPQLLREAESALATWRLGDDFTGVIRTGSARISWRREGHQPVAYDVIADSFGEDAEEDGF